MRSRDEMGSGVASARPAQEPLTLVSFPKLRTVVRAYEGPPTLYLPPKVSLAGIGW